MAVRKFSIIIAASVLFVCPSALAQPEPSRADLNTARALFAEATSDESAEKWAEALKKFERVAAIKTTAGVVTHMATCKSNLGLLLEAEKDYRRAAELARTENNQQTLGAIESALAKLRSRISTIKVVVPDRAGQQVDVSLVTTSGELFTTPESLSRSPDGAYTLRVDPGREYVISVEAPGMRSYRKKYLIPESQTVTVDVTLEPERAPTPPPAVQQVTPAPEQMGERQGFWTTRNAVTISLLGAGVLATAAGAGFALASNSKKDEADGLRDRLGPSDVCAGTADAQTGSTCAQLRDAIAAQNSRADVSLGLYVTGGALLVGGAAVWFLWPKPKSKSNAAHVTPVINVAGRSIGLQGVF